VKWKKTWWQRNFSLIYHFLKNRTWIRKASPRFVSVESSADWDWCGVKLWSPASRDCQTGYIFWLLLVLCIPPIRFPGKPTPNLTSLPRLLCYWICFALCTRKCWLKKEKNTCEWMVVEVVLFPKLLICKLVMYFILTLLECFIQLVYPFILLHAHTGYFFVACSNEKRKKNWRRF